MSAGRKTEEKSEIGETVLESLVKRLNDVEAKLRRYGANWKKFAETHLGQDADDGKLKGSARVGLMMMVVLGMAIGSAFATDYLIYLNPNGTLKYSIDVDGNVYATGTNTATAFAGDGSALTGVGGGAMSLASNKVFIGSAAGAASAQTVSGNATITTGGVITVTGYILPTGKIMIGSSTSNATAQAISGDIAVTTGGVTTVSGFTLANNKVMIGGSANTASAQSISGDIAITTGGVVSLSVDCVAAAEMADADHGDVTWASGVASIDDNAVLASELGAGTLAGDVVYSNDVGTITVSNMTVNGTITGVTGNFSGNVTAANLVTTTDAAAGHWLVTSNLAVGGTSSLTGAVTCVGNVISDEIDANTATALLVGKATATSVTLGAADAGTTVQEDVTVVGGDVKTTSTTEMKYWLSTNAYMSVSTTNVIFVQLDPAITNILTATGT